MSAPFIHLKAQADRVEQAGQASFHAGHRIENRGAIDGVYAEWEWDGETLAARNDRYGIQPLFYYEGRNEIALSPSVPALLTRGAPSTLDDAALAVFLRMGFFIGDDTPFASIRALPPQATLTWREGRMRLASAERAHRATARLSRAAALDGFISMFRNAIERRAASPDHVVLTLTGGRDSRHILLELQRQRRLPKQVVTCRAPGRDTGEVSVAATLAAMTRISHVVLSATPRTASEERLKNLLTNFCADEHVQFLPLRRFFERTPAITYDGIGGDVLSQSRYLTREFLKACDQGPAQTAMYLLDGFGKEGIEGALAGLLTERGRRLFDRESAERRLNEEAHRHLDAPNPVASFFFWNRTRREIALAPYALLDVLPTVFAPYLDHELFDFLMSIPATALLDRRFHTDTISQAFPDATSVPYGEPTPSRHPVPFRQAISLLVECSQPSRLLARLPIAARAVAASIPRKSDPLWFASLVILLRQLEEQAASAPPSARWPQGSS